MPTSEGWNKVQSGAGSRVEQGPEWNKVQSGAGSEKKPRSSGLPSAAPLLYSIIPGGPLSSTPRLSPPEHRGPGFQFYKASEQFRTPTCEMVMPTSRVAPLLTNMEEEVGSPEDKQFTCFSDPAIIPKDSNVLSAEVVKKVETAVEKTDWVEVVSIVRKIKQEVRSITVKIAVTGDSGNGMSSFINALRFIGHDEEKSAPTGVVRTTRKPDCYFSPNFPNVDLWDLPGTGVTDQSMENYLEEMACDSYDLIIIIASEQFSSNHVKLATAMQTMRKRFYIVWAKLDRDLSTSTLSEPQLRHSIQKSIQENLQKEGVKEPPIFLVSSFEPLSDDFKKLRKELEKDISDIRYDGLLGTLFQICEKTINEKVESIKRRIDGDHLNKDFGISSPDNLEEYKNVFQKIFGVDDKSLNQVALYMRQPDDCDTDATQSQVLQTNQQDGWTVSWLYHSESQYFFTGLDYFWCCFDSHRDRCRQQKYVLDKVAKKTKEVLWEILRDCIVLP